MSKALRFAILTAAVSLPTAALAQAHPDSRSVAVTYADLDLGSPAGRRLFPFLTPSIRSRSPAD